MDETKAMTAMTETMETTAMRAMREQLYREMKRLNASSLIRIVSQAISNPETQTALTVLLERARHYEAVDDLLRTAGDAINSQVVAGDEYKIIPAEEKSY